MKLSLSLMVLATAPAALASHQDPQPVTEIITGIANARLNADPTLINTLKVTSHHGPRFIEEAWGQRIEEAGVWQGFLTWEPVKHDCPSLEHDPAFNSAAPRIFSSHNFTHVAFAPFVNLTRSIAAPITETIFTSILPGADPVEFEAATQHALDVAGAAEGCLSGAHGHRVENATEFVMVLGWVSKEAHEKYAMSDAVVETTNRFLKVGSIDRRFHVTYSSFL